MSGATKKKSKFVWKKKDADTTPEAPQKVVAEKTPAKEDTTSGTTTGPPTKQQQRQNTLPTPPSVDPSVRTGPFMVKAAPRLPKAGIGEETTDEHVEAVRSTWDLKPLFDLAYALATQDPERTELIETVRRQIIRAQLALMMGGNNASRANIHADGVHLVMTGTRETDPKRKPDRRRTDLTDDPDDPERAKDVWNASLRDTEVDTIRDIKAWASTLDKQTLEGMERIVIDVVGTSGPCDACKERLQVMAKDVVDEWSGRTGLSAAKLPELGIWSYYGNPPDRPQWRGRVKDVINGWIGDNTPPDMEFWNNKRRMPQPVREHPFFSYNVKQPVVTDTTTENPGTAKEKSNKSEDLVTSTET